jgi:alpha-N-arabinofuranosidase
VDSVATLDPDTGELVVFAVHRGRDGDRPLRIDLRALPGLRVTEHLVLGGEPDRWREVNDAGTPDRVAPRPGSGAAVAGDHLTVALPPVSWTVLRLAPPSE